MNAKAACLALMFRNNLFNFLLKLFNQSVIKYACTLKKFEKVRKKGKKNKKLKSCK